jgi:hypothetical protein
MWRAETKEVIASYHQQAEQEKLEHKLLYPTYELKPRKSSEIKKRKVKAKAVEQLTGLDILDTSSNMVAFQAASPDGFVGFDQGKLLLESGFNLDLATDATASLFDGEVHITDEILDLFGFNFDVTAEATANLFSNDFTNLVEEATSDMFSTFDNIFANTNKAQN